MTFQSVNLTHAGEIATLTLTGRKSSMGPTFWPEVPRALRDLRGARVLILRGEELFSAGLDVRASAPIIAPTLGDPEAFSAVVREMHAAIDAFAALPIPVIAAVHGWCIGAGLELIAACDLRLCSADARFSLPEVKLGITADLGGLQRLPPLIGLGRAAHLALTALPIDAPTAERWGLVTEVLLTPDALFERAHALATHLAALPARALEGTKRTLHDRLPHDQSLANAVTWNARHMTAAGLAQALK
ncbi:enoyl-CoA hydratase/isomerase family protein [Deinococcus taeanensis]|uniref:enoyl-CoA hydratase-related protein n=1 Tax=Deinococcus taeanensis TaxID=2737050 RepID=UPI001CDBDD9A|nr:enoyl-CoA hydratase-related protein [Deinococcus taeanensis]UBV42873.1 enoyl-CoA hydratase/isomerase family protein [Deinococcus taeanensis]